MASDHYDRSNRAGTSRMQGARFALLCIGLAVLSGTAAQGGQALGTNETASITRFRIQHQVDTVEVYRRPDGRWWVADRDLPARPDRVQQTLRQLETLVEDSAHALGSDKALAADGLQLEYAHFVKLNFKGGKVRWIRLGLPPNRKNLVAWARDAGNPLSSKTPRPSRAFYTVGLPVSADINSWTTSEIFPQFDPVELDSLHVTWVDSLGKSHRYFLARSGDSVVVGDSLTRKADRRKAYETLGQSASLFIDRYVEPDESVPKATTEPRVSIRLVMKSGKRHALTVASSDIRYDYLPHPESPQVLVKMLQTRMNSFKRTSEDLATSYPYGPDEDDGVSGPPPPGFGVFAPHSFDHHSEGEPEGEEHHEGESHEGHKH